MKPFDIASRTFQFSVELIWFHEAAASGRRYWSLHDQLLRSGTSIGANIIEGKSASTRREMIRYYEIARRSARETTYWLGLLKEGMKLQDSRLEELKQESEELSRIISASLRTLKSANY